jgi:prepilin-type N-terminal cleavage/methylation domain-containing protein
VRGKASEASKGEFKLCHSDEDQTPPNLPLLRGGIDQVSSHNSLASMDISLLKGGINQVSPLNKEGLRDGDCFISPLNKGGLRGVCSSAFTLVELIVVITILAIL